MATVNAKPVARDALDHWAGVHREYSRVEEFIDWLHATHGVQLDWDYAKKGTPLSLTILLDQFFEVDRKRLEQQRRALLASISGGSEEEPE